MDCSSPGKPLFVLQVGGRDRNKNLKGFVEKWSFDCLFLFSFFFLTFDSND